MNSPSLIGLSAMLICTVAVHAEAAHRFVLQGNKRLAIVEADGRVEWEMPWGGIHDLHVLPSGNIMVQQGPAKVVEIDRATKQVVWSYDSATQNGNAGRKVEVHAFQPLADGRVMIAESGPARIIEIDRSGKLLHEVKLKVDHPHPHTDTRLVRKLPTGNYLVCHEGDGTVREYDPAGRIVWEYEVPLFGQERRGGHGPEAWGNKCFAAVRLPSGNTLISTGNGHGVIEVTPKKRIVWQLGQNDLSPIVLAWVTTLEVLPNGNYALGNCHAGPGQPVLVELDPRTKKVVWQFDGFEQFGNSVSNSQLLDLESLSPKWTDVGHIRATIRVRNGRAKIEVVVRPGDVPRQLRNPRLLVTTKVGETTFLPTVFEDGTEDTAYGLHKGEMTVTLEDGVWTDQGEGLNLPLQKVDNVDPLFDIGAIEGTIISGPAYTASFTLPAPGQVPMACRVAEASPDGKLTAVCETTNGIVVYDGIETYGHSLGWDYVFPSAEGGLPKKRTVPRSADGGIQLSSPLTKLAADDFPPAKPRTIIPKSEARRLLKDFSQEKSYGLARLDLPSKTDVFGNPVITCDRSRIALDGDGETLFVVDADSTLRRIETADWTETAQLPLAEKCSGIAVSSVGVLLALQDAVLVVDAKDLKPFRTISVPRIRAVCAAPATTTFGALLHHRFYLFDAATGEPGHGISEDLMRSTGLSVRSRLSESEIASALFSADGSRVFYRCQTFGCFRVGPNSVVLESVKPFDFREEWGAITCNHDGTLFASVLRLPSDRAPSVAIFPGANLNAKPRFVRPLSAPQVICLRKDGSLVVSSTGWAEFYDATGSLTLQGPLRDAMCRWILPLPDERRFVACGAQLVVLDFDGERLRKAVQP